MTASVSVVIPAYNANRFLKDCIDSVRRQSLAPFEILVIDDGSTDDTRQIAESSGSVRCISQENAGVSVARNRGIQEAGGNLVALLDADDVWREDKLALQVSRLGAGSFAYSSRTETDARLQPIRVVENQVKGSLIEALVFQGNVVGTPSSVLAPRSAFLEAGSFDPRLSMCADWDMWIRLALILEGNHSREPLVSYRIHGHNMSANLTRYESDCVYLLEKMFKLDLPRHIASQKAEAGAHIWEVLAGSYWSQGRVKDAIRCTINAVGLRPSRMASLIFSVPYRMTRRRARGAS